MMRWLIGGLSDCYDYFEPMLLKGLNMSITAAYCALAVMVLRLLLKKQPKVYSYALWLIVAFRLLCPVSFENVFSLMRMSPESIPADITSQHIPSVSTGIGGVDVVVNQVLTNFESCVNPLSIWMFFGSILWLLVAAGLFGYGIGSYLKMRMELKDAEETEPGVWVSERLKTPFVFGFFKPAIYLPAELTKAEKAYVLEHERTHIRRGDHLVKAGAFLLLCLHWFNPVLWAAFFLMCKDMEMSCDEKVIKKLSGNHTLETKKDYASTLLSLASNHRLSFGGPLAFGEGNIKKRIANVLQYKKRTVVVSTVLVVVVLVVIFLFVGNPKPEKQTGGVPVGQITPTPTPDGWQMPGTSVPEVVIDTSGMELLEEKDGVRYYYGVIEKTLTETGYFTLNVPEECVDEICYYLELAKQKDGSYAVQDIDFYLTKDKAEDGLGKGIQLLDSYHWIEMKEYLEQERLSDFRASLAECVIINAEGTGGYLHTFPLDMALTPGTPSYEAYETAGRAFDIRTQLTIHIAPQNTYTAEELAAYAAWQEESLGRKLLENVYYGEIEAGETVTPYFELEVHADCVDKVSYLLILEEKADGTKAVSDLQFFYTAETKPKDIFVTEPKALSDYFVTSSWFGGIGWAAIDDYTQMVPEHILLDWVNRISTTGIRQLEPIYQAEAAPFGREFVWVNKEETGAYFYYEPTDVQWSAEFEDEYLELKTVLKKYFDITFYNESDAISWAEFVEKLKEFPVE